MTERETGGLDALFRREHRSLVALAYVLSGFTHVVWREAPDVVAHVEAVGVTEEEVLAVVESLRPATEQDWRITHGTDESTGLVHPL